MLALLWMDAEAQLVLRPTGVIERPSGNWTDTVLTTFDLDQPIGTLRRVDGFGDEHALHAVFTAHPATVLKGLLGPGLVAMGTEHALTLRVNRLRVDELGNRAVCILHGEILQLGDAQPVRLFETSVMVENDRCGKKETCHEENVRQALANFFDLYKSALADGGRAPRALEASDPEGSFVVNEENSPVLAAMAPKRGLYRTFMQFRSNAPDTVMEFELKEALESPGDGSVVRAKHLNGEEREDCWGLSDGNHAYVRVGRIFVRLTRNDDGFQASVPMPKENDVGAVVLGGLFFGAIGGAIAGGVAVASAPLGPPLLCELNMLGGDLVPRDPNFSKKDLGMNIFHVSKFAKHEAPIHIVCEKTATVELVKGQWTGLELPPQAAALNVMVRGVLNEVIVPITTNTDRVTVYLINMKKDGAVSVSELGEQMRNAVMKDLKKEDRR